MFASSALTTQWFAPDYPPNYLEGEQALLQGMLPTPTEEYHLETLLHLIQEAQEQAASEVMTSEEAFW